MPIVLPPEKGLPLEQGDILDGVTIHATDFGEDGKSIVRPLKCRYVLVVSRPCKAIRSQFVVVAPVAEFKLDLAKLGERLGNKDVPAKPSLDRMRRYLAGIRDGGDVSDEFYLGSLDPSAAGKRFAASIETLHSIMLPSELPKRQLLVDRIRVGRLDPAFLRDLHVRLHLTFARLGFDDHTWYSDDDLNEMVLAGTAEVIAREAEHNDAERSYSAELASGKPENPERAAAVNRAKEATARAREAVAPFVREQEQRTAARLAVNEDGRGTDKK